MIKYEDFEKAIRFIDERNQATIRINEAFTDEFEDSIFYPYTRYETAMVELLVAATSEKYDTGDDIYYFIYDLDCGREWEPGMVTDKDGNDIKMETIRDLYDYIVKENNIDI